MRFKSPHDQRLDGSLRQPGGDNRDVVKTNVFNVELGNAWLVHMSAQIITGTGPCTCPTDTGFDAAMRSLSIMADNEDRSEEDCLEEILSGQAIGGLMEPDDMASTYLFLASDHASNITGQALSVDRGELLA